ncbi:DUF4398 domain-containing protein [Marinobacter sp. chi1]|uniref:DUF4398 domain-containing protein n=1 Tax=Marinobacter suaedae TaxID=3057675 RepID=A0ABT8VXN5_9GAMM|nr:DUF4398 domain-containing protein [Marinobacter sp. chi1]MDO3720745.1 DUF4398 domain-containing protein [Marinobacter sp. chi1]
MNHSNQKSIANRLRGGLGLAVATVLISACASAPLPPTSALKEARDAIATAEQAGARQHAGAELDEAQQKLLKAERSVSKEQMQDAERLARESAIAAELATARTESAKAMAINREMGRSADALTEEMGRQGEEQ